MSLMKLVLAVPLYIMMLTDLIFKCCKVHY